MLYSVAGGSGLVDDVVATDESGITSPVISSQSNHVVNTTETELRDGVDNRRLFGPYTSNSSDITIHPPASDSDRTSHAIQSLNTEGVTDGSHISSIETSTFVKSDSSTAGVESSIPDNLPVLDARRARHYMALYALPGVYPSFFLDVR